MAYTVIAAEVAGYDNATKVFGNFKKAHDEAEKVAIKTFGIDLPAGWDQAPIHRTPINCWECGRFSAAAGGKLTQGDLKEGWVTDKDGTVRCPEHAKAKKLVEVFGDAAPAPAPNGKRKPSRTPPPYVQAAVAVAAHVHGHTRPAPKPSAKKTTRRKTATKGK